MKTLAWTWTTLSSASAMATHALESDAYRSQARTNNGDLHTAICYVLMAELPLARLLSVAHGQAAYLIVAMMLPECGRRHALAGDNLIASSLFSAIPTSAVVLSATQQDLKATVLGTAAATGPRSPPSVPYAI